MRLRLPLLLGALVAAAISAAPAHGCPRRLLVRKPSTAGDGQAQLQEARDRAGEGQALRDRDDHSCGVIRIVLDRKLGGPIPNSIAFLAGTHFFDGLTIPRVVSRHRHRLPGPALIPGLSVYHNMFLKRDTARA